MVKWAQFPREDALLPKAEVDNKQERHEVQPFEFEYDLEKLQERIDAVVAKNPTYADSLERLAEQAQEEYQKPDGQQTFVEYLNVQLAKAEHAEGIDDNIPSLASLRKFGEDLLAKDPRDNTPMAEGKQFWRSQIERLEEGSDEDLIRAMERLFDYQLYLRNSLDKDLQGITQKEERRRLEQEKAQRLAAQKVKAQTSKESLNLPPAASLRAAFRRDNQSIEFTDEEKNDQQAEEEKKKRFSARRDNALAAKKGSLNLPPSASLRAAFRRDNQPAIQEEPITTSIHELSSLDGSALLSDHENLKTGNFENLEDEPTVVMAEYTPSRELPAVSSEEPGEETAEYNLGIPSFEVLQHRAQRFLAMDKRGMEHLKRQIEARTEGGGTTNLNVIETIDYFLNALEEQQDQESPRAIELRTTLNKFLDMYDSFLDKQSTEILDLKGDELKSPEHYADIVLETGAQLAKLDGNFHGPEFAHEFTFKKARELHSQLFILQRNIESSYKSSDNNALELALNSFDKIQQELNLELEKIRAINERHKNVQEDVVTADLENTSRVEWKKEALRDYKERLSSLRLNLNNAEVSQRLNSLYDELLDLSKIGSLREIESKEQELIKELESAEWVMKHAQEYSVYKNLLSGAQRVLGKEGQGRVDKLLELYTKASEVFSPYNDNEVRTKYSEDESFTKIKQAFWKLIDEKLVAEATDYSNRLFILGEGIKSVPQEKLSELEELQSQLFNLSQEWATEKYKHAHIDRIKEYLDLYTSYKLALESQLQEVEQLAKEKRLAKEEVQNKEVGKVLEGLSEEEIENFAESSPGLSPDTYEIFLARQRLAEKELQEKYDAMAIDKHQQEQVGELLGVEYGQLSSAELAQHFGQVIEKLDLVVDSAVLEKKSFNNIRPAHRFDLYQEKIPHRVEVLGRRLETVNDILERLLPRSLDFCAEQFQQAREAIEAKKEANLTESLLKLNYYRGVWDSLRNKISQFLALRNELVEEERKLRLQVDVYNTVGDYWTLDGAEDVFKQDLQRYVREVKYKAGQSEEEQLRAVGLGVDQVLFGKKQREELPKASSSLIRRFRSIFSLLNNDRLQTKKTELINKPPFLNEGSVNESRDQVLELQALQEQEGTYQAVQNRNQHIIDLVDMAGLGLRSDKARKQFLARRDSEYLNAAISEHDIVKHKRFLDMYDFNNRTPEKLSSNLAILFGKLKKEESTHNLIYRRFQQYLEKMVPQAKSVSEVFEEQALKRVLGNYGSLMVSEAYRQLEADFKLAAFERVLPWVKQEYGSELGAADKSGYLGYRGRRLINDWENPGVDKETDAALQKAYEDALAQGYGTSVSDDYQGIQIKRPRPF